MDHGRTTVIRQSSFVGLFVAASRISSLAVGEFCPTILAGMAELKTYATTKHQDGIYDNPQT